MSKKQQKNQANKKQAQIVDQQKDPMLRALQKKVRNINKKLNQITQLASRKDLKPEQQQKVAKKQLIIEERDKYQEMIEIYKQIAGESEKVIRKMQLTQLEDLAQILVVKEYGVDLGPQVNSLAKIIATPSSNELSLQQRVQELTNALIQFANNGKLKKNVREYVQNNSSQNFNKNLVPSNQPEPISSNTEQERKQQLKEFQKQESKENLDEVPYTLSTQTPQQIQEVAKVQAVEQAISQIQNVDLENKKVEEAVPPAASYSEQQKHLNAPTQSNTQNQNKNSENQRENGRQYNKGSREDHQGGKGRRIDRNGGRHYDDDKNNYKKRSYKPKNEDQKPKDHQSQGNSSDSQPKARQFRRQEVRQLIEDGFIVVGKPKPKPKDTKQYKQYHNRQHGKRPNYQSKPNN